MQKYIASGLFSWLLMCALGGCGGNSQKTSTPQPPADNKPPTLSMNVGRQQTYIAPGDVVDIRLTASDPNGDSITIEMFNKPSRAELNHVSDNEARFRWDPVADETTPPNEPLRLLFAARDVYGAKTQKVHYAHIRSSSGKPTFTTRSNHVVDIDKQQSVEIEIEVSDDESERVDIQMKSSTAPAGASFEQNGTHSGLFQWEPTSEQRKTPTYSITFVADDGNFEPVEFELSILFKQPD